METISLTLPIEKESLIRGADVLIHLARTIKSVDATIAVPAPAPPSIKSTQIETFPELMSEIAAKDINSDNISDALSKHGINSLSSLASKPEMVPKIAVELGM